MVLLELPVHFRLGRGLFGAWFSSMVSFPHESTHLILHTHILTALPFVESMTPVIRYF